jgi:hypothetical protein
MIVVAKEMAKHIQIQAAVCARETRVHYCILISTSKGVFSSFKILKNLQDSPSHRIVRRMHEALNIGKKDN